MNRQARFTLTRRDLLRLSLLTTGATLIGSRAFAQQCLPEPPQPHAIVPGYGSGDGEEAFPTSPFILYPFTDPLPIPTAAAPADPTNMLDRNGARLPAPDSSYHDSYGYNDPFLRGKRPHQIWPTSARLRGFPLPNPIVYHVKLQVNAHRFTSSLVQPISVNGFPVVAPDGIPGPRALPASTIYGFNGTFPGPMINVEYGKPVLVRFENELDVNPLGLDRGDFGAPDWAFLTHLHNGHTAPESDGNPCHMTLNDGGYIPGDWCDNLYLMWPPDNDDREKQSFCWFHDHRMHHTGANVYKGMVGLMPFYDPVLDMGNETNPRGLRLPGRRRNHPNGTFDVDYDIPLALYDCSLDDGVTPHQDWHNGCGETHPEWWGQTFFRHYPNHGFVGDIFTVNGVAYPVLHVYRRKYRLRFLDASIARIYQLWLMSSSNGPVAAPGSQGQWQLPDGQQCMRLTQIASEGGLLPRPIVRDSFEIWPAKRREFIVDFTRYMDGTPTTPGDEIYLVNTMCMPNGRKPVFSDDEDFTLPQPGDVTAAIYRVPMLKIVIGGAPPEPDLSRIPRALRPMPPVPRPRQLASLPQRTFTLERSGTFGGETEWLINGLQFDPLLHLAYPLKGSAEVWTIENGGGGWVHPLHIHEEEHRVLSRNGLPSPDTRHPDDTGKEDVVALDPGESVTIYRKFRTFTGMYVCHCHNLAHEDHNMMFGWEIV